MGFSLEAMFRDISNAKSEEELREKIDWWEDYARQCGALES